jgi:hypothetical protein
VSGTTTGRLARGAAGLLALVAVASSGACSGDQPGPQSRPSTSSSPSPTATPTTALPVPTPPRRACYRLDYDAAVAPTSDASPVPCRRPHTSQTYAVGRLATLVGGHLLAVDSDRVQARVAATCPRRFAAYVGGSVEQQHLSMLRAVWFTPTVEESDGGADWYRCDAIAVAGDERLARLTGRLAGVLDTEAGRDRYGTCGTAEPGAEDFTRVICSADHAWRAIATVEFTGNRYPGVAAARERGQGPCEDAGRAVADDALDFQWGYEWPTADDWAAGRHFGLCWAPD